MKSKISSLEFDNLKDLKQSALNWEHECSYTLLSSALIGEHHAIELENIQLSFSQREGGFMQNIRTPKESVSIAVILECQDRSCLDDMKLHKGDILFLDDSKTLIFMSKGKIQSVTISIPKYFSKSLQSKLSQVLWMQSRDNGFKLAKKLESILQEFLQYGSLTNAKEIEDSLILLLHTLLKKQTLTKPKLTKGEKIALTIRDKVYGHMDGNISIEALAKEYGVSEQTLRNSFKSLFGFTPKRFFRLMKLNHVYNELKNVDGATNTVNNIARKWGFPHMGSFSKYYTEMFGENPSTTLKRSQEKEYAVTESCVTRKEEMD